LNSSGPAFCRSILPSNNEYSPPKLSVANWIGNHRLKAAWFAIEMKVMKPKADYDRIAQLLAEWERLEIASEGRNAVAIAKRLPVVQELHDLTKDLYWEEEDVIYRANEVLNRKPKRKASKKKK
jgi:hypothetical protein